jgi:hypothetical protein
VIALDACHCSPDRVGRHPERVALALHDEDGHLDGVEFRQARLLRPPGGMDGKRETENGDSSSLGGGTAGDTRAERAAARDQWEVAELVADVRDDRRPCGVELRGRRWRAPTGDAIRLFDERNRDPLLECDIGGDDEVGSRHASPGAMTKRENGARRLREVHMNPGGAMRGFDVSCHGFA